LVQSQSSQYLFLNQAIDQLEFSAGIASFWEASCDEHLREISSHNLAPEEKMWAWRAGYREQMCLAFRKKNMHACGQ
jgi:hypothetical protein